MLDSQTLGGGWRANIFLLLPLAVLATRVCAYDHPLNSNEVRDAYLFWEPLNWSELGECRKHRDEVGAFAQAVANSPIEFRWMTYNDLWEEWSAFPDLAAHASYLKARYQVRL